jgi:hypothetical protein
MISEGLARVVRLLDFEGVRNFVPRLEKQVSRLEASRLPRDEQSLWLAFLACAETEADLAKKIDYLSKFNDWLESGVRHVGEDARRKQVEEKARRAVAELSRLAGVKPTGQTPAELADAVFSVIEKKNADKARLNDALHDLVFGMQGVPEGHLYEDE